MRIDFALGPSSTALLQLNVTNRPYCANETHLVKTACLPKQAFSSGTECAISGWGMTETRKHCVKSIGSPLSPLEFSTNSNNVILLPNALPPFCCIPWCV